MKFFKGTAAEVAASAKTGTAGDLVTESDTGNISVADGSTLLGALKRLVRFDEVPILSSGKVPEANIPDRLSESGLTASIDVRSGRVFTPETYGATGDGTTLDTTALTATFAAARAAGGEVRLTTGKTYLVNDQFDPTGCTVTGYGATIKVANSTNLSGKAILASNGSGTTPFSVLGVTFDMNATGTTDPGDDASGLAIYAYAAPGTLVRDVTVRDSHRFAVRVAQPGAWSHTDGADVDSCPATVENLTATDCRGGVFAEGVGDLTISNSRMENNSLAGLYLVLCNRPRVVGNLVSGSTDSGIVTLYSPNYTITGNTSIDNGGAGITIGGGDPGLTQTHHGVLSGNTCRGNTAHGIWLDITISGADDTPEPLYGVTTGNICDGNTLHGIYVMNSAHVTLSGNQCRDNGDCGIAISSSDVVVEGNQCRDNGEYGIGMFGNVSFPNYGRHRLGVNYVDGNTLGGYVVESVSVTDVSWASLTTTNPEP